MEVEYTTNLEALRKEAWKYENIHRDTKTKACEYGLLMFRLDTLEDTLRCMKRIDNRSYGIATVFQLTEHTIYGIQLLKNNKPVYPYNVQQQMRQAFNEIQENTFNDEYDKAIEIVQNIRKTVQKYIVY